jgi:hypothetical protein
MGTTLGTLLGTIVGTKNTITQENFKVKIGVIEITKGAFTLGVKDSSVESLTPC